MNDTILIIDDDIHVISSLQRSLYRTYRIEIAAGAQDALDAINHNTFAVVVSDLQMPGMNGTELLGHVKRLSPETVRILLTGRADVEAAISAVNEGNVFRFLTKPCPQATLCKTLDAALEQYRLQVAEKEVLQETLTGTVAILVEILSAIQPLAFGRASRIRAYVRLLAAEMGMACSWEFEAAAMLSQIGCISVDPRVLKKHYSGEELTEEDRRHLLSQATVGRKLLHQVPRLQAVSQMIERQYQNWHGAANGDAAAQVAMGAQLLHAAIEFDRLAGTGKCPDDALAAMRHDEREYHPGILAALETLRGRLAELSGEREDYETTTANSEQLIFRPIAEQVLRSLRE
jgi:response regulator RpfG family c-di-GMP phosphodiesterase